jgi:LysR family cys regulon transcriptional activator
MKFQQLRYLVAVHENGLNITAAARQLHTSQPGVSRQLKLLEEELGFQLFEREGRALTRTTAAGEEIISRASSILREMQNIRRTSAELRKADGGTLSIATTHTQARYVLPQVIRAFRLKYPKVRLHLHQGTSEQIAEMVARDRVDFAIATGSEELFPHLVRLPVYRWHRAVVVPRGHPLASAGKLTLKKLAEYPIVTYVFSFSGRSSLPALFETAGLSLDVALTARDSDVIKTYVRIGLGVGILARLAIDPKADADLVVLDAAHLFEGPHDLDRLSAQRAAARLHVRVHRAVGAAPAAQAGARNGKTGDPGRGGSDPRRSADSAARYAVIAPSCT